MIEQEQPQPAHEQQQSLLTCVEGGHNYMIAVDGSRMSMLAFEVATHGLFRPNKDVFNVITITDSRKEYLPVQYKPDFIEGEYRAKIHAFNGEATFIKKEVIPEKSTKETLFMMAQMYHADVIVCGMHGRKGPKSDLTVAGTAVQYLAQQPITMVIIKDTNAEAVKQQYRFGVLFDGSPCAEKTLHKTMSMMNERDRLTIITVVEPQMDHEAIRPKIEAICLDRPYDLVVLDNEPSCTIRNRIKMYLKSQVESYTYIDFVAVGNRGLNVGNYVDGENYLGTVAQAMIGMKKLNVIFVP